MTNPVTVGLLHPGQMGAAVGGELVKAGARVLWCSAGRSDASIRRAEQAGLEALPELGELSTQASMVISLCPPAVAEQTADAVREVGFNGVFVEANPISPECAERIATAMAAHGARVVDGCVIGPPPGGAAARVFDLWESDKDDPGLSLPDALDRLREE